MDITEISAPSKPAQQTGSNSTTPSPTEKKTDQQKKRIPVVGLSKNARKKAARHRRRLGLKDQVIQSIATGPPAQTNKVLLNLKRVSGAFQGKDPYQHRQLTVAEHAKLVLTHIFLNMLEGANDLDSEQEEEFLIDFYRLFLEDKEERTPAPELFRKLLDHNPKKKGLRFPFCAAITLFFDADSHKTLGEVGYSKKTKPPLRSIMDLQSRLRAHTSCPVQKLMHRIRKEKSIAQSALLDARQQQQCDGTTEFARQSARSSLPVLTQLKRQYSHLGTLGNLGLKELNQWIDCTDLRLEPMLRKYVEKAAAIRSQIARSVHILLSIYQNLEETFALLGDANSCSAEIQERMYARFRKGFETLNNMSSKVLHALDIFFASQMANPTAW